ncbi:hypothetical protein C343_01906 [Cryptococcus neoformans C23]|uniref:Uncharacterized protein n=2 Tax=Cryptococcus neoformans TaxID=5207 RepID=J9VU94_CRYN9|nr:hypothetical protein, variant [Cryptococcus neoformans var. grubii H99]XP_012052778.1 hypothetical protein CNAG_01816 [Cryptococcus neoformans var. grubii H99]AUB28105.1 hypothetical protein CKF44_01816 [Cryptococcus neoformans var. grubii]OWZ34591.1 hypothetical protein C347_01975 [Cryptococcus neoformans var. grubii AD2-60a]OWZ46675.1 hypothetical protein C343_01906 [Cryptococcus neoformans var. grubii C23]OWZ55798.1 hypothetical protein C368_02738 [Cryptococcus neoformans var. grubii 125|eukprot:XP_012052777.1 hypothetical protein, variant [Cryptococcus neoformans var. grubii H99]
MPSHLSRLPRPAPTQPARPADHTSFLLERTLSTKSSVPSLIRTNSFKPLKLDRPLNKSKTKHVSPTSPKTGHGRSRPSNIGHARSAQSTPTRIPSHARLSNQIFAVATPFCTPPSSMETPKLPNITKGTPLSQGPNDDELLKDLEFTFVEDDDEAGEEHITNGKQGRDDLRSETQGRSYESFVAVTEHKRHAYHHQLPRSTPPSSSILRKSLVESKRQLELTRKQRNELDSRIVKLEREGMKNAWTELVRMANAELEEVCKAKELLLQLKSDLDSEDYDAYTC